MTITVEIFAILASSLTAIASTITGYIALRALIKKRKGSNGEDT